MKPVFVSRGRNTQRVRESSPGTMEVQHGGLCYIYICIYIAEDFCAHERHSLSGNASSTNRAFPATGAPRRKHAGFSILRAPSCANILRMVNIAARRLKSRGLLSCTPAHPLGCGTRPRSATGQHWVRHDPRFAIWILAPAPPEGRYKRRNTKGANKSKRLECM